MQQEKPKEELGLRPRKAKNRWVMAIGIALLVIIMVALRFVCQPEPKQVTATLLKSAEESDNGTAKSDTPVVRPVIKAVNSDSTMQTKTVKKRSILNNRLLPRDTTLVVQNDTLFNDSNDLPESRETTIVSAHGPVSSALNPCEADSTAPWAYADPGGGLHDDAVRVRLQSKTPCTIEWALGDSSTWHTYSGIIDIDESVTLFLRAHDSCGRVMETRSEYYEITYKSSSSCSKDMVSVIVGSTSFCIDRYEWPNKKGVRPASYVSLHQAIDSCYTLGKRLCTGDEWTLACSGPWSSRYPYGNGYESYTCVTQDTAVQKSGSKPECRGYFGAMDMSGNLAEWTATKSMKNRQFNNVMGGFWESGEESKCTDVRYSYYPQNRHNPVGFRCCKNAK